MFLRPFKTDELTRVLLRFPLLPTNTKTKRQIPNPALEELSHTPVQIINVQMTDETNPTNARKKENATNVTKQTASVTIGSLLGLEQNGHNY